MNPRPDPAGVNGGVGGYSATAAAGPSRSPDTTVHKAQRTHQHESSDEEDKAHKKAKTRSCDDCRRRKVKCVMVNEELCESCRINLRPCTFLHEGKKREKPVTKKDADLIQAKIKALEQLLNDVLPGVDLAQLPRTLDQARTIVKAVRREQSFQLNEQDLYGPTLDNEPEDTDKPDDPELAIDPNRYIGPHSALSLVAGSNANRDSNKVSMDATSQLDDDQSRSLVERLLEREHLRKRREDASFPPTDLAASLIDLYFRHIHRWDRIIHKPTFMQLYGTGAASTNPSFRALCYAVFAAASRFSDDPRVLSDGQYGTVTKQGAGAVFGAASYLYASAPSVPWNLFDLQYAAVMSRFLISSSSPTTVWAMTGCWMRTAQDVGAHRERTPQWTRSIMHDQLRKRAFWFLTRADRQASLALGRNSNVRESQIDLDAPLFITDEALSELQEKYAGQDATSTRAHWVDIKAPADKPLLVAEERWHEIKHVVPAMVEKRYNSDWGAFTSSAAPAKKFRDMIEQQLFTMLQPVQTLLKYPPPEDADIEHFVACARSQAELYFCRCLLHRNNFNSADAVGLCVESAMGTIAIFEECRARGVLEDGIFLCPQFLIMAIMMLLYAHKRFHYDRRPLADAIWLIVKRGVSLLANLARTTYLADKVQSTISRIVNEVELKIAAMDEGRLDPRMCAPGRMSKRVKPQANVSQLLNEARTSASASESSRRSTPASKATNTHPGAGTSVPSSSDSRPSSHASSPAYTNKVYSPDSASTSPPSSSANGSSANASSANGSSATAAIPTPPADAAADPFAVFNTHFDPDAFASKGQFGDPSIAPGNFSDMSNPAATAFDFASAAADSSAFWELFGFDQLGSVGGATSSTLGSLGLSASAPSA